MLISSFTPLADNKLVSASPDRLKWSIVDTPSEEGNVVVSPSEINAFVLGSDEIFYAIDIPHRKVYKSTDGGITWEDDLTQALEDEGATLPAWDIAIAPNNSDLVAVVSDNRTAVYLSEDGGESWGDIDAPDLSGLLIADIAISKEYGDFQDIAIGTRKPDGVTNGDVWVRRGFGTWKAQELDMDVTTVRFSPNYSSDRTILAIGSNAENTYLCTGVRNTSENTTDWEVTDPNQVEVSESSGESPGKNEIIVSDLALPSDYSGRKAGSRVVYAAYSSNTTADDIYRIEDDTPFRLDVNHGSGVAIASIAYHGTCSGGKLLTGEVMAKASSASALIHICFNPEEAFPKWEKPSEFNSPTGGAVSPWHANAQVAWSSNGETAYCGTSTNWVESAADWAKTDMTLLDSPWRGQDLGKFDESAFSESKDGGDTWNQLSLIDTQMSKLYDFALSADAKTLYLTSINDDGFDSLWRSQSETLGEIWERILCFDSETDEIILRHTPEESEEEAIFFAVLDSDYARYSLDKGETWERVWDCPDITDLAVVSNEMFYILDDNLVNKCWWNEELWEGIWEWQRDVDTGLRSGYTVAISGEDFVFVGEKDDGGEGKVAYSADGGVTFELTEAVPDPGNMQVMPDEDFDINRFIYAASDEGKIYRWTIEGSTSWRELNPRYEGFCGLAQKGGALYGAYADRRGIARTLIPHLETVTEDDWDWLKLDLPDKVRFKPGSLKAISDETIDLWAIDDDEYFNEDISQYDDPKYNTVGRLWVYSDTFVLRTPWPTSPAIGGLLPCDPCTCRASRFCFRWREIPLTEEYEIWIAMDEEFTAIIHKEPSIAPADLHSPAWCPRANSLRFVCGETYYWKVRSCKSTEDEIIHSRWSPPMYFTVKTGTTVGHMHIAPVLKVPEPGSSDVSLITFLQL